MYFDGLFWRACALKRWLYCFSKGTLYLIIVHFQIPENPPHTEVSFAKSSHFRPPFGVVDVQAVLTSFLPRRTCPAASWCQCRCCQIPLVSVCLKKAFVHFWITKYKILGWWVCFSSNFFSILSFLTYVFLSKVHFLSRVCSWTLLFILWTSSLVGVFEPFTLT